MALKRENLQMVGKLAVVVAGMFAFGYALVPLYRAICEVTGINILSLTEGEVPGNGKRRQRRSPEHAGRSQPHHHGGVRCQCPWHLGIPSGGALGAGAPGPVDHGDVRVPQQPEPPHGGAGDPELRRARRPRISTSWSASASTSTPWSRARSASGRWPSSSTRSCPGTSRPSRCPTPSSRWGQTPAAPDATSAKAPITVGAGA